MSWPPIRTLLALGGLAWAAVSLAGCAFQQGEISALGDDEQIELGSSENRGAWPFWPTAIRILPLTRLARTDGAIDPVTAPTIEIRVEAMDSTGEPTRAVGIFVVSVDAEGAVPATQRWKIDVRTAETHSQRFDTVTDTYRFDLTPTWTTPPARGTKVNLKVVLFGTDGATPAASATVTW